MKQGNHVSMIAVVLLLAGGSLAQNFNFAAIDVPNAQATWASGINPAGKIVGGYIGQDGLEHGYVYSNGTFTTIGVPGWLVGVDGTLETEVNGINPAGDMVGDYFAPPGAPGAPACVIAYSPPCDRGFLYSHGKFSSVLVPGHVGSVPQSIAPNGSIYGCLHDQKFGVQMFGFVRIPTADGKSFTYQTLQAGGGELEDPAQSYPISMNNGATPDASTIVGLYTPAGATRAHGYQVRNGVLTDYMFPGSLATAIWGINPDANSVGLYRVRNAVGKIETHGFLQPSDGTAAIAIDFVDPVTGAPATLTEALGINPAGAIVGVYLDSNGSEHGFLAVQNTGSND